jgi:endonuclease YncB( thermonuclease family)
MSRVPIHWCLLGTIIAGASTAAAQAPTRASGQIALPGPTRVIEADTLEVWANGSRFAVAVAGITAPAGNTPCGRDAIAAAARIVAGPIWLDEDTGVPPFDSRHRRIYRVTTSSNLSLAVELALAGVVQVNERHRSASDYPSVVAAQQDARSSHRGCLWSSDRLPDR